MAGLHFDITGDNSNLMDKLKQTESGIRQTVKTIEQSGVGMERMFSNIAKAAAGIGAAFSAQQFAGQVMKVRGEFQQLEVAFTTMLGSAEKANTLMTQLTRTAAVTPFGLQDVANGAKQLLAYGVASEQVNDTLVRLGDIAAGLSIPLNDLVYLYGTTMTQGRLFTQDLRQFQGRGIPLADELANQFGVTKDKVGELVTAGKVGFAEVEKAIVSMTSQGGKFGGLMEAQSKTIIGQISNIEDAIDGMFNEIGKSSEGMINVALDGVSTLVENWEKVADAIGLAAASYGSYQAALMVTTAVDGIKTDIASSEEIAGLKEILGLKEEIKNADLEEAVAKGTLTQAKAEQMAALREEVQARMASLKLMQEEAEAEEKAALNAFNLAKQEKDAVDERLENMMNLMEAAEAQGDASYTAYAQEQLQTASANANTAANRLNTAEKNLNAASSKAKAASTAADTFATNANTIANHANTRSLSLMKAAALQLQGILRSMYATLMANPLAIVVGAVGALTYSIYQYATRAGAAEKATRQLNETLEEQTKKHEENKKAIDELVSTLGNAELSEGKRIENFQKLKAEYPEILKDINTENEFLKEKHRLLQLINNEQSKEHQKDYEYQLRIEEQKLKRWEEHRLKYGDTSLVDVDGNGWASDNVTEAINAQKEIVEQLKANISQPIVETYLSKIKELKDENIAATINEITNTLVALEGAGDNAIGILSSMGKEFSKSQLKTMKAALEGEQVSRGGEKKTASQWLAKYKKEYEAAEKAITDFQKKAGEMSEELFERNLKELKDKRDAAKKKYQDAGGSAKIDNKKQEQQQKSDEQLLTLRRKNQQEEIALMQEGTEKKVAQIELDYQKEIDEIEKQRKEWEKVQSGILTDAQQAELGSAIVKAEDKKNKELSNVYELEAQSMREFLKEYGSFQQQKLAIAEEYAKKIEKAQTKGDKLKLEKERDKAIQDVEIAAIKTQIDWGSVFGDFGTIFKEQLQPTIDALQKITQTDTFKSSSAEDQKLLYGIINNLQKSTTVWDGDIFTKVTADLEAYKNALKEYNDVMLSGTATAEQVSEAQRKLAETTSKAQASSAQASNMFSQLADGLKGLGSGTLEGIGNGLMQLDELFKTGITKDVGNALAKGFTKLFGENSEATKWLKEGLGDAGFIGGLISAVLSILDILKEGVGTLIASLIDTILGAIEGILDNILSGKFIEQIVGSLIKGVGGILDTITRAIGNILTLGLASGGISDWFKNSNAGEVAETTERLTARNEILTQSIDALRDEMEKARGMQTVESHDKAVQAQEELIKNTGDILAAQMGYHSAHHSNDYYISKALTDSDWAKISTAVGKKVASTSDLWNLSPEDLKRVSQLTDVWEKIYQGGKYDKKEYLDSYLELAGTIEELNEKLNESLTQISFDSMYDSFIDKLMDMESDTKDFADDISKYFMKAMLANKIGELYSKDLEAWYKKYADYMKNDGTLDENEMDELRKDYDTIVAKAINERNAIAAATGYNELSEYTQEASAKGFQSMSQETGDELNGRFTALQISNEDIKNQMIQAVAIMNQMVVINSQGNVVLNDILVQQALANNYLADIVKYTKAASLFGDKLDSIIENTKNL